MTKPERLLAVAGVAVVASAALLIVYVRQSNPADAQAPGCATQRTALGETLDQVRFSTSAAHSVSTALQDTQRTRNQYVSTISTLRRRLVTASLTPTALDAVRGDLGQASWILSSQDDAMRQASALVSEDERELASATPLIREASDDIREDDCPALSLTLARSGWPKDRLIAELSEAAHLNAQLNDKLDLALGYILKAQRSI